MKITPYKRVFGQPPQTTVFPGVSGHVIEEDVEELLVEGLCVLTCMCAYATMVSYSSTG